MSLIVAPIVFGILGVALLYRGVRGRRIDDHPLCRRCGYDLIGANERRTNCPECGTRIDSGRTIRFGHRKRRWASLLLGVTVIVFAAAATIFVVRARAANFDFNPYKPLWVLRLEVTGADSIRSAAAKREIMARFAAKRFSQSQMISLAHQALQFQADLRRPWDGFWGDVFDLSSNAVSDAKKTQWLKTAVTGCIRIGLPARVRQGQPVFLQIEHKRARVGRETMLVVEMTEGPVVIDGVQEIRPGKSSPSRFSIDAAGAGSHGNSIEFNMPPGRHGIELNCLCRVGPLQNSASLPPLWDPEHDLADDSWVIAQWPLHLETSVEIVPPSAPVVELLRDQSMAEAIRACVTIDNCSGGSAFPLCMVRIDKPPVNVAFDILWRKDGHEGRIGSVIQPAGESWMHGRHELGHGAANFPDGAQSVDIVLRGNPKLVETNADIASIWDGELAFKDVAVKWIGKPTTRPSNR